MTHISARAAAGGGLFVLGLLAAGCGGKPASLPPTFKVTGTVTYKTGTPVKGGAVQFAPVADTTYTVSGDIKDDGSFTLATVKGNDRVAGAPEGEYRVTVMPPIPADQKGASAVVLPKPLRVEAKDNTFPIEIAGGK